MTPTTGGGGTISVQDLVYSPALEAALREFGDSETKNLNTQLLGVLEQIAASGLSCYPWPLVKLLLQCRIKQAAAGWRISLTVARCQSFFESLDSFSDPPFTIQRMCELALKPNVYSNAEKYLFALEKLTAVSSTCPTRTPESFNSEISVLIQQKQEVDAIKESFEQHTISSPTPPIEEPMVTDTELEDKQEQEPKDEAPMELDSPFEL